MGLNEVSIEQLQQQFVDTNKISSEIFDKIKTATNNKGAYATWLVSKVVNKIIGDSEIPKYKRYFELFDKYKNKFTYKDINQYKQTDDVADFVQSANKLEDELSQAGLDDNNSSANLVPKKGIDELKSVGISLLGVPSGYQCFKVPEKLVGNEVAWKIYRKWLANCSVRKEDGVEKNIAICTMGSIGHFDTYLKDGPFYVFFNLSDPLSPYQFHYESNQFKDKNNTQLI